MLYAAGQKLVKYVKKLVKYVKKLVKYFKTQSIYKLVKTEIGHKVNVSKLYQIFSNLWWQMCVILTMHI